MKHKFLEEVKFIVEYVGFVYDEDKAYYIKGDDKVNLGLNITAWCLDSYTSTYGLNEFKTKFCNHYNISETILRELKLKIIMGKINNEVSRE